MAVQSLLRDVESNLEKEKHTLDEHARAVKISLSPYEVDQKMEWVENYVCRELYDRYIYIGSQYAEQTLSFFSSDSLF